MKNRVLIDISGREFALITDETESYMKTIAAEVNKMINESTNKNIRTSKSDAALLICLDLCDKKTKLSMTNDNMRAQLTSYIEEIDELKKRLEKTEQQLAIIKSKNNSADNDNDAEKNGEDELQENQSSQSENFEDGLQDENAGIADANNIDDINDVDDSNSVREKYKPENKVKPKSSTTSYGSYLFGKNGYKKNIENSNRDSMNSDDDKEKFEKKREKDFDSLKERFNRLQRDMSKP